MSGFLERLPGWIRGHQLATIPEGTMDPENKDDYSAAHVPTSRIDKAHIILSHEANGGDRPHSKNLTHRPVLDIDFPLHVEPSTTPGHYHLYLDKPMSWGTYSRLLEALAEAGVIESGYAAVSKARGYTSVRLPWVKKNAATITKNTEGTK